MGESVEIPLQSGLINEGVRSRQADPTVYPEALIIYLAHPTGRPYFAPLREEESSNLLGHEGRFEQAEQCYRVNVLH
jgi:hypothetical protein